MGLALLSAKGMDEQAGTTWFKKHWLSSGRAGVQWLGLFGLQISLSNCTPSEAAGNVN